MKECPKCHTRYDDTMNFCTKDGSQLIDLAPEETNPMSPEEKNDEKDTGGTSGATKKKGRWKRNLLIVIIVLIVCCVGIYNYVMNAATYLRVEPQEITVPKSGKVSTINIDYDGFLWKVNYLPKWISMNLSSNGYNDENSFNLSVEPNNTGEIRNSSVTIQSGRQSATVNIHQKANATKMSVSDTKLSFDKTSVKPQEVTLTTDGVSPVVKCPDWVTVKQIPRTDKIQVYCCPNDGSYRTGYISFKEDNASASIYVTQGGECSICKGKGSTSCYACGGTGRFFSGMYSSACWSCGGKGKFTCATCKGKGEIK